MGAGRLGQAIIRGLIRAGINSANIAASVKTLKSAENVRKLGIKVFLDNEKVIRDSDLVIIALKPHTIINVLHSLATSFEEKIVVSVAALIPLKTYSHALNNAEIYRAMPNINVEINKGFTALCGNKGYNAELVEKIFSLLGEVVWVDEDVLDKLTLISASTPALVAELIDAMELAALYLGVPHDLARKAVINVFAGTAELTSIKDLLNIRNAVITPKGITIKLLRKYLSLNIKSSIMDMFIYASNELDKALKRFSEYSTTKSSD
ncbi:MAG: pyrroline-5-carboxylate reductase family protein [Thermoprotei archaeon]